MAAGLIFVIIIILLCLLIIPAKTKEIETSNRITANIKTNYIPSNTSPKRSYLDPVHTYKVFSEVYQKYMGEEKVNSIIRIMENSNKINFLGRKLMYSPNNIFEHPSVIVSEIDSVLESVIKLQFAKNATKCYISFTIIINAYLGKIELDYPVDDKYIISIYSALFSAFETHFSTVNANIFKGFKRVVRELNSFIDKNEIPTENISALLSSQIYHHILYGF